MRAARARTRQVSIIRLAIRLFCLIVRGVMKHAIVILSDPKPGTDEAIARVLNALAFADECQRCGDELAIVFAGAGTRWPAELSRIDHPGRERYNQLREHVRGASRGCAMRNHAAEGLEAAGVALLSDNAVAGTPGVASIRRYYAEGWNVTLF